MRSRATTSPDKTRVSSLVVAFLLLAVIAAHVPYLALFVPGYARASSIRFSSAGMIGLWTVASLVTVHYAVGVVLAATGMPLIGWWQSAL